MTSTSISTFGQSWNRAKDVARHPVSFRCLSVLLLALALSATSCQKSHQADPDPLRPRISGPRKNPAVPAEYLVLAKHLADTFTLDANEAELDPDVTQILAEMKAAIIDLEKLRTADGDIGKVAQEAHAGLVASLEAIERLQILAKPPGVQEAIVTGLLHGFLLDIPGVLKRAAESEGQAKAIEDELRTFIGAFHRLQSAMLLIPNLAKQYGGPKVVQGQAAIIDYDEAWGPFGPKSRAGLLNYFGDLHHCTILIELRGRTEVSRNVHFIPEWKSGVPIHAMYSPGEVVLDQTLSKQTVPEVQEVIVSVWADELTQEEIHYQYRGKARDLDIERYCQGLEVTCEFRPFQNGLFVNTHRGVQLQLNGMAFIEQSRVAATFRRGQESKSFSWNLGRWQQGESKTLDTQGELTWDPDTILVEVEFPGTSYKHSAGWRAPK